MVSLPCGDRGGIGSVGSVRSLASLSRLGRRANHVDASTVRAVDSNTVCGVQGVLFHEAVTGADASMSSLLQLLATVHLLSSWAATVNADRPVRRRLAFAALAGEDWGYLGSTSLVRPLPPCLPPPPMHALRIGPNGIRVEMSSRGRFAAPADSPLSDCSPCTEGYTHVHRSSSIL